jgi:hypothetical protein
MHNHPYAEDDLQAHENLDKLIAILKVGIWRIY